MARRPPSDPPHVRQLRPEKAPQKKARLTTASFPPLVSSLQGRMPFSVQAIRFVGTTYTISHLWKADDSSCACRSDRRADDKPARMASKQTAEFIAACCVG